LPKILSILTPCYNEEANVRDVYLQVRAAVAAAGNYRYEHIFIDNASTDNTLKELKAIAAKDRNVKVIRNTRNFGHIRSPMHALYQASGDAVIGIVADLQDPPEMIVDMIRKWEEGYPVVICVKVTSGESGLMFLIRKQYYKLVSRLSGVETYENYTGFGLYDRKVVEVIKSFDDPYPYFRGMIAEAGFRHFDIPYHQPKRKRGITKNNFYSLYDVAMLGITNLSKVPLRLVTFSGFVGALVSVLVSLAYLTYKLIFWSRFSVSSCRSKCCLWASLENTLALSIPLYRSGRWWSSRRESISNMNRGNRCGTTRPDPMRRHEGQRSTMRAWWCSTIFEPVMKSFSIPRGRRCSMNAGAARSLAIARIATARR
jgi:glycosyltransferase involved in cell wall biosynthesis